MAEFMSVHAMGPAALARPIGNTPVRQAGRIHPPCWVQHFIHGEANGRPLDDRVGFQTRPVGQFNGKVFFALDDHCARHPLVSLLLATARPSAVFRRVVTIIVNAVERVASRPFTHVGRKIGIGRAPAFADANSPS